MRILGGPLFGRRLTADFSVRTQYLVGRYEPEVTRVICSKVHGGQTAYDVGAHVGYFSLLFGKLVKNNGRVFAFEPSPHAFPLLTLNCLHNSDLNVETLELAMGEAPGTETFSSFEAVGSSRFGNERDQFPDAKVVEVKVESIDHLVATGALPPPDFAKIDVEGAELRVLEGMRTVLALHHPVLLIEAHETEEALRTYLADYSYRSSTLGRGWGGQHLLFVYAPTPQGAQSAVVSPQ